MVTHWRAGHCTLLKASDKLFDTLDRVRGVNLLRLTGRWTHKGTGELGCYPSQLQVAALGHFAAPLIKPRCSHVWCSDRNRGNAVNHFSTFKLYLNQLCIVYFSSSLYFPYDFFVFGFKIDKTSVEQLNFGINS